MIKYTKAAIDVVIRDIKILSNILKYLTIILSLAYYIYALIAQVGNSVVNIVLISLIGCFLVFELITIKIDINKITKRVIRRIYRWSKLIIKASVLAATLYSLYLTSLTTNGLTIVLSTLTIIFFIIQLIVELLRFLFERYKDLLLDAVKQDIDNFKENASKPVENIVNVTRKIFHKEPVDIYPISKKSKRILKLEKHMNKKNEKD